MSPENQDKKWSFTLSESPLSPYLSNYMQNLSIRSDEFMFRSPASISKKFEQDKIEFTSENNIIPEASLKNMEMIELKLVFVLVVILLAAAYYFISLGVMVAASITLAVFVLFIKRNNRKKENSVYDSQKKTESKR